jgi:hypothetical protein
MKRSLLALILLATPAFAQDEGGGFGWVSLPPLTLNSLLAQAGGTNTMNCRSPSAACRVGALTATTGAFSGLLTLSAGMNVTGTATFNSSVLVAGINDSGTSARVVIPNGALNTYIGEAANSGTNVGHLFKNTTTLSGSTRIAEFHNDSAAATAEAYIADNGALGLPDGVGLTYASEAVNFAYTSGNQAFNMNSTMWADAFAHSNTGSSLNLNSRTTDASASVAVRIAALNDITTAGRKLVSIGDNGTAAYAEKAFFDLNGALRVGVATLPTCAAANEWLQMGDPLSGVSTGKRSKLCLCTSDGGGTPAYVWQNLATGTLGTTTTCGSE